jgi:hypothetical protein
MEDEDSSSIKSIFVQEKIEHFYQHDQMELDKPEKRLLGERDKEKHLREAAEKELAVLKQKLSQLEMEKK